MSEREQFEALASRIGDYLSGGGLFNPELADHVAVRDLLIECRAALSACPVPVCHVARRDFRWDDEAQCHVPQLLIEFEPVPSTSPNDARGWRDRDQLAAMLAAAPTAPAPAQPDTLANGLTESETLATASVAGLAPAQPAEPSALVEAARFAADVLAEIYAKYQTKIGPFASQAQKANVMLGAALKEQS